MLQEKKTSIKSVNDNNQEFKTGYCKAFCFLSIKDSTKEAIEMAFEVGLDLVEVSPNADPPVCKILDYGKFKYEAQKKANEARKKQKVIEVKEIKMRPGIDNWPVDAHGLV